MKHWIKLETDLMQDARIMKLFSELGLKGLAAYVLIRMAVESQKECTERYVENVVGEYVGRRLIRTIIRDFDLFGNDESGQILAYACTRAQASAQADVQASAQAIADAPVHLIVPSEHNLEKEKEREKKKRVSVSMLLKLTTSPQERAFYQEMLERFPRVCQMDKVLTYEQFQRVQAAGYSNQQIRDILQQMENNRHLLTKYVSAYLTLNNWIKGGLSPRSLPQGDLLRGT